jgi:hypothetical protein
MLTWHCLWQGWRCINAVLVQIHRIFEYLREFAAELKYNSGLNQRFIWCLFMKKTRKSRANYLQINNLKKISLDNTSHRWPFNIQKNIPPTIKLLTSPMLLTTVEHRRNWATLPIFKKSKLFLGMSFGTRRSRLMKKPEVKNLVALSL